MKVPTQFYAPYDTGRHVRYERVCRVASLVESGKHACVGSGAHARSVAWEARPRQLLPQIARGALIVVVVVAVRTGIAVETIELLGVESSISCGSSIKWQWR